MKKQNILIVVLFLLFTYFMWWKTLNVQVVFKNIFFILPGIFLFFSVFHSDEKKPQTKLNAVIFGFESGMPLKFNKMTKIFILYFILIAVIGIAWGVLWVGMSPSFYNMEDGTDFSAQEVDLAGLKDITLFQTSVVRKVPENTGEIRLRANRFGWADVIDTDPVYENGELVWRAVIEPRGLINQLTKSAPGVSQTSAEVETSPVVTETDLENTEAKMFSQFSKRRAWYHNRFWLIDNGYITTDTNEGYWWVYPRISINWFIFTYKKTFEGVTLVNAKTDEIKHYNPDEFTELAEFLGKDVRSYPESLALKQASIYGYNRFGWWAKYVTQRSDDGESLYEIPGGQLRSSSSTWQKYPFLTVYNDELYWVVIYEPIGGEISGARIAGILLIGADHGNSGEITLLKLDKLERNLAGVNKIFRFARAEVQNFEGWIPQQVQIYQDDNNKLYALSSIVSGSGSGQRIMALAGVDLLGEEERAYVIKTSEYSDLGDAHAALLETMFGEEVAVEKIVEAPAVVQEDDTDKRLDAIDAKLDMILEKLGEE